MGRIEGQDDLLIEQALIGGEAIAADQGGVLEIPDPETGLLGGSAFACG